MSSSTLVWDWHLHCPVLVSNTILRTLVPPENLHLDKYKLASVKSNYQVQDYNVVIHGGIAAGVNFPAVKQVKDDQLIHDDDIHVLLAHEQYVSKQGANDPRAFAELAESTTGLAKIRIKDSSSIHPSLVLHRGGAAYLRADAFREALPDVRSGESSPFPRVESQNIQNRNVVTPAWTHSCAFRLAHWPTAANEWLKRKRPRGFVTEQLVEEVRREGCYLVPAGPAAPCWDPGNEGVVSWTYSFVNAECRILNSLSVLQKHVFVLLKILCFQKMSSPRVIEVSHLRALFFQVCEKVPEAMWRPDQLTQLLMYTLDELLHQLIDHILPHPFIKELNLWGSLSGDFLDEMQGVVAGVRQNALSALIEFSQRFPFPWTPRMDWTVCEPLRKVVDKDLVLQTNADCVTKILLPFLVHFTRARVQTDSEGEIKYEAAMEVLSVFNRMLDQLVKDARLNPGAVFWFCALLEFKEDHAWQIRLHEYIVEHVECEKKYVFKGNLACYYHTAFSLGKVEYKAKAKDMFQSALEEPNASNATKTDYAVFLYQSEDWEAAQSVLSEITAVESSEDHNGYDALELRTLEPSLRELGEALGELSSVPTVAHAFYLQLAMFKTTGTADHMTADAVLQRFSMWCADRSKSTDYISYALLALAFERLGRYDEAIAAYVTASMRAGEEDKFTAWASSKVSLSQDRAGLRNPEKTEDSGVRREDCKAIAGGKGLLTDERKVSMRSALGEEVEKPQKEDSLISDDQDNYDEQLQQAIAMSLKLS